MNIVDAIVSQTAVDNALSSGVLEKARTMVLRVYVDGSKEHTTTTVWTPQNNTGYIGLDPPLM